MDEFSLGTNPQEARLLARALVRYLGTLDCVALMTTHTTACPDVAGAHYQVAGLRGTSREIEGDDPASASPGGWTTTCCPPRREPPAPGTPSSGAACSLDDALMDLFQADP